MTGILGIPGQIWKLMGFFTSQHKSIWEDIGKAIVQFFEGFIKSFDGWDEMEPYDRGKVFGQLTASVVMLALTAKATFGWLRGKFAGPNSPNPAPARATARPQTPATVQPSPAASPLIDHIQAFESKSGRVDARLKLGITRSSLEAAARKTALAARKRSYIRTTSETVAKSIIQKMEADLKAKGINAHFDELHGPGTTDAEQYDSAVHGKRPGPSGYIRRDSHGNPKGARSTRFLSYRSMLKAIDKAKRLYVSNRDPVARFQMEGIIGEGYYKGGVGGLKSTNLVTYQFNATGDLVSIYPQLPDP